MGGRFDAANEVEQRGFAAARRAGDGKKLSWLDAEINTSEGWDRRSAEPVLVSDGSDVDEAHALLESVKLER